MFSRGSFARHFLSGFALGAMGLIAVQAADARHHDGRALPAPTAVTETAR